MAPPVSAPTWRDILVERYTGGRYGHRPVEWVAERAREHLWSAQRAIAASVLEHRYTAVHSAHELGKSMVASRIIAWWIDSHPPGEAFVVSTAPTAAQVSAILWREIGKVHARAGLVGRVLSAGYPQWKIGSELVGYGRKPADYEESAFQGIHARYVLVVVDEAGGVAKHLFDAIDSIVANENSRVLAIGNPDDPGSHFATICKPGSDWNVIHLDGLRSPNMTKERVIGYKRDGYGYANPRFPLTAALMRAEGIEFSTETIPSHIRELLLDPLWVEERIRRWAGVSIDALAEQTPDEAAATVRRCADSSPLFQAKVRGIFPTSAATGVIPLGWVQQAVNRWHDWSDAGADLTRVPNPSRNVVGVDVAYGGQDETAIAVRYGDCIAKIDRYRHADTTETTDYAAAYLHEPGSLAVVDVIGIGAGVYDLLRRYRRESRVAGSAIPFNAAASSARTDQIGSFRFRNDRAAAWWKFRELLDPSKGSRLMLPDDERLIEELVTVKYEHLVGGVIKIESKDDIRKRLGRSTDSADAVIQSFWVEGLAQHGGERAFTYADPDGNDAGAWLDLKHRPGSAVIEYDGYDPFTDTETTPGLTRAGGGW